MTGDLLGRAHALSGRGEPFAIATVVRAERPTSARPGMKAIVLGDGTMEGWVGGSCAQPVVVREGLEAMRTGAPRLIRLSAQPGADQEGVIHHTMTCHSGGALEIYVEPVLPKPQLLLIGEAPLVGTLAGLGRLQGFAVWIAGEAAPRREADLLLALDQLSGRITPSSYVVVATMGAYDEEALAQVAGSAAAYVGLVASRRRAEAVFEYLAGRGVAREHLQRIKVPAGLDIGAVTPEEIAVSIMAEIIQLRRARPPAAEVTRAAPAAEPTEALDPVCGMTVEIAGARHTAQYDGATYYFCSGHCKAAFERNPERYAAVART